jgi:hypothetical protein
MDGLVHEQPDINRHNMMALTIFISFSLSAFTSYNLLSVKLTIRIRTGNGNVKGASPIKRPVVRLRIKDIP